MQGAKGGDITVNRGLCNQRTWFGGGAASLTFSFPVGPGPNALKPGGTLKFYIGQMGTDDTGDCNDTMRGSGGGSSAVLYLPPGQSSTGQNWIVLAVAGGGGGAHRFAAFGVRSKSGFGANATTDRGDNVTSRNGITAAGGTVSSCSESKVAQSDQSQGIRSAGGGSVGCIRINVADGGSMASSFAMSGDTVKVALRPDSDFSITGGKKDRDNDTVGGDGFTGGGAGRSGSDSAGGGGGGGGAGGGGGMQDEPGGGGGSYITPLFGSVVSGRSDGSDGSTAPGAARISYTTTEAPAQARCKTDPTVVLNANGQGLLTVSDVDNSSTTGCAGGSFRMAIGSSTGTFFQLRCVSLGIQVVRLQVVRNNAVVSECTSNVTVRENTAPTAVCTTTPVEVPVGNGSVSLDANLFDGGSFDNCGGSAGIVSRSVSPASVSCSDVGSSSVTLTVTDRSGNSSTCTAPVTVKGAQANCQTSIVKVLDASGLTQLTVNDLDNNSVFGVCDGTESLTLIDFFGNDLGTSLNLNCARIGTGIDIRLRIKNETGATVDECRTTFSVVDTTAPTAICPTNPVSILVGSSPTSIDANLIDSSSTDNCGITSRSVSPASVSCSDLGSQSITLTVTDGSGNSATCNAPINVVGAQANCQPTITKTLGANGTTQLLPSDLDNNSFFNNCAPESLRLADGAGNALSAPLTLDCSSLGSTSYRLQIVDNAGVVLDECSSSVTVEDGNPSAAICASPISKVLDRQGRATVSLAEINNNSVLGLCDGGQSLRLVDEDGNILPTVLNLECGSVGEVFPLRLQILNSAGSVLDECSTSVTAVDETAPTLFCDTDTTIVLTAFEQVVTLDMVAADASDICGITAADFNPKTISCADLGSTEIEVTIVDAAGNVSTCQRAVTIVSAQADCQAAGTVNIALDANGVGQVTIDNINRNSVFGACDDSEMLRLADGDGEPISDNALQLDCGNISEDVPIRLQVVSSGGEVISQCSTTYSVSDATGPTVVTNNITITLPSPDESVTLTAADVDGGSTDNCGITDLELSQTVFDQSNVGANEVTLTVVDVNGNQSQATATVTVVLPNVRPMANLEANPTSGTAPLTVNFDATSSTDVDGSIVSYEFDFGDGNSETNATGTANNTYAAAGTYTTTVIAIDNDGLRDTATLIISVARAVPVADLQATPTSGPAPLTVFFDATGSTDPNNTLINYNYIYGDGGADTNNSDTITYTFRSPGTYETVLTILHEGFQRYRDTVTITVTSAPPTADLQATPTAGTAPLTVNFDATGSSDSNGEITSYQFIFGDGNQIEFDQTGQVSHRYVTEGTFEATVIVTDDGGETDTATVNITVTLPVDNTPPVARCTSEVVELFLDGEEDSVLSMDQIDAGSSDDIGIAQLRLSQSVFGCADVGAQTVRLTVVDVVGQSDSCDAQILVRDTIAPFLFPLDGPERVILRAPNYSATISASELEFDSEPFDFCGIDSIVLEQSLFTLSDLGLNTLEYRVVDVNGNEAKANYSVDVFGAPFANLQADPSNGVAPLSVTFDATGSTDPENNIASYAFSFGDGNTETNTTGTATNTYTTPGTYLASLVLIDIEGLMDTAMVTITVNSATDTIPPVANCNPNPNTVFLNNDGQATLTVDQIDLGSTDNVGITSRVLNRTTVGCSDVGSVPVTLTVSDAAGNSASCEATVEVRDPVFPIILPVEAIQTIVLPAPNYETTVTAADLVTAEDSCGVASVNLSQTLFTESDLGLQTITATALDVNGNEDSIIVLVEVLAAPQANLEATPTAGTAPLTVTYDATASTDLDGDIDFYEFLFPDGSSQANSDGTASITYNTAGTFTTTVVVIDEDDLRDTATLTITVELPELEATLIVLGPNAGVAPLESLLAVFTAGGTNDTIVSYEYRFGDGNSVTNTLPSIFYTYQQVGVYEASVVVTDNLGRTDTATTTITVLPPGEAPIADLQASPTSGTAPLTVNYDARASTDPDGTIDLYNFIYSNNTGLENNTGVGSTVYNTPGIYTDTLIVTDNIGQRDTATVTITVNPASTAPVARCTSEVIEILLDAQGQGTLTVDQIDNGSTDDVGITSRTLRQTTFGCADVGLQSVTLVVEDADGNQDSCTAQVQVRDQIPPSLITLAVVRQIELRAPAYERTITPEMIGINPTDACGVDTVTISQTVFGLSDLGTVGITYTATDVNGNADTQNYFVEVIAAPQANLQASPTSGTAPLTVNFDATGSTDPDSSIASYEFLFGDGNSNTNTNSTGTISYTYTAAGTYNAAVVVTDNDGLRDTATVAITVNAALQPPVAGLVAIPTTSGEAPFAVNFVFPGTTDPDGSIVSSTLFFGDGNQEANPDLSNTVAYTYNTAGTYTASLVVTDNDGLRDTATVTITVTAAPQGDRVVRFQLVDAARNLVDSDLSDGDVIDLNNTGDIDFNIQAITNPMIVGSVKLALSGQLNVSRTENVEPYEIFGNSSRALPEGSYTLTATPFSQRGGQGDAGTPLTINFQVVRGQTCTVVNLVTSNFTECNNQGTGSSSDDTFTVDVTVNYVNPPSTGTLMITRDGTASVDVSELDGPTSHTFRGVTMQADGRDISLEAEFSSSDCELFQWWDLGTAPAPCSGPIACDLTSLQVSNISSCNGQNTPSTGDDTYTADVTVNFVNAPTTGNLVLTGDGSAFVAASSLSGGSYTFPNVTLIADGGPINLTASFTAENSCSITNSNAGTAPGPCSQADGQFIDRLVLINADTDQPVGAHNPLLDGALIDKNIVTSNLSVQAFPGPDQVGSVVFQLRGPINTDRTENVAPYLLFGDSGGNIAGVDFPVGSYTLTVTPYTQSGGNGTAGTPTLVNFTVTETQSCLISSIAVSNATTCNDQSTMDSADDTFMADVTVVFANAPATGTLTLSGDGSASEQVANLDGTTGHTFLDVVLPADGGAISLTAAFSAENSCSFTESNAGTAPGSCSGMQPCVLIEIATSNLSACSDPGTEDAADDTFTADVTVTFSDPPSTGSLALTGDGTATVAVANLDGATSHTFQDVVMAADGSAIGLTARFSDDSGCALTNSNAGTAPTACSRLTGPQVDRFVLIDADSDLAVDGFDPLEDSMTIDKNQVQSLLNFQVVTVPGTVGSVLIELSGPLNTTRTEGLAPYAAFGDRRGNYLGRDLPTGDYTLTATPYSGPGRTGIVGTARTITFQVVAANGNLASLFMIGKPASPTNLELAVFPNPFQEQTTLQLQIPNTTPAQLDIYNLQGQRVWQQAFQQLEAGRHDLKWNGTSTNGMRLPSGIYVARLRTADAVLTREIQLIQ